MKKLISIMLCLMLVVSMATVAFAAENDTVDYTPVAAGTSFKINKTYENENNVIVSETLKFVPVADSNNPTDVNISVADLTVDSLSEEITVTLPEFTKAGIYRFTITETAGDATGVTYSGDTIHVAVLVAYDNENNKLVIENTISYIEKLNGTKDDTFTNSFKSGSFTVEKAITGNMADKNDTFEITVTLTAPANTVIRNPITVAGESVTVNASTYTKTLTISQNTGKVTFSDIPDGVIVTVSENTAEDKMNGYTYVDTKYDGATGTSLTVDADAEDPQSVVVTNNKNSEVDTGITLDSVPFVLILVVCAVAVVLFVTKRRRVEF